MMDKSLIILKVRDSVMEVDILDWNRWWFLLSAFTAFLLFRDCLLCVDHGGILHSHQPGGDWSWS